MYNFFWCKQVNRILVGKDQKFVQFLNRKPTAFVDPVKLEAHKKYLSKRKMLR